MENRTVFDYQSYLSVKAKQAELDNEEKQLLQPLNVIKDKFARLYLGEDINLREFTVHEVLADTFSIERKRYRNSYDDDYDSEPDYTYYEGLGHHMTDQEIEQHVADRKKQDYETTLVMLTVWTEYDQFNKACGGRYKYGEEPPALTELLLNPRPLTWKEKSAKRTSSRYIDLRLRRPLYDKIEAIAKANGVSVQAYIAIRVNGVS